MNNNSNIEYNITFDQPDTHTTSTSTTTNTPTINTTSPSNRTSHRYPFPLRYRSNSRRNSHSQSRSRSRSHSRNRNRRRNLYTYFDPIFRRNLQTSYDNPLSSLNSPQNSQIQHNQNNQQNPINININLDNLQQTQQPININLSNSSPISNNSVFSPVGNRTSNFNLNRRNPTVTLCYSLIVTILIKQLFSTTFLKLP